MASRATIGEFLGQATYPELIAELDKLRANYPDEFLYLSLEEGQQMAYAASHAMETHFDIDPIEDAEDYSAAYDLQATAARRAILESPETKVAWEDLVQPLDIEEDAINVLAAVHQDPEFLVEPGHYVQKYATPGAISWLADLPNGYFAGDLNPFQVLAVCEQIESTTPYRFIGMGASFVGFSRETDTPLDIEHLMHDLKQLYGYPQHPAWDTLAATLPTSPLLFLGYAIDFTQLIERQS